MNEIVTIKQLPIIEERLKALSETVQAKVSAALLMDCTEETVKEVKKVRADLNKEKSELESQRKAVKEAVMKPYNEFEGAYKQYIGNLYTDADLQLREKIDAVEAIQKAEKEQEVKRYFSELAESMNIDFVQYEDAKIAVTLSASLKSLKEQAHAFMTKIDEDLKLIDTQADKAEILAEYKETLNVSKAITVVNDRKKRILAEQEAMARRAEAERAKAETANAVNEVVDDADFEEMFSAPVVAKPDMQAEPVVIPEYEHKEYTTSFTVTATLDKLKALKRFMDEGGYKYGN